jgi:copper chaperone
MEREIFVENLKCGGCANTIKTALSEIKGVENISVDVTLARITFRSPDIEVMKIKEKLSSLGYPEVGEKNNLIDKAKSYVSCAIGKIK